MPAADSRERAAADSAVGESARACRWRTRCTTSSGRPRRPTAAWSAWACTTPSPGATSWSCWQVHIIALSRSCWHCTRQGRAACQPYYHQMPGTCQAELVLCSAFHRVWYICMLAGAETDPSDTINEIIFSTRKVRPCYVAAEWCSVSSKLRTIRPNLALLLAIMYGLTPQVTGCCGK